MQFSYAASFSSYQTGLTLAKVPAHYNLDTTELESCLEADDKSYSLRHYLCRVLGFPICKPVMPDAHQRSYTIPDEPWLKSHKSMLREEWKRHKFVATGFIPGADATSVDIIAMYESF